MAEFEDLYEVLGIKADATNEEIKRAYRDQCFILHPDRLQGAPDSAKKRAEEKLVRVNKAYAILSDSRERQRYHTEWLKQKGSQKTYTRPHMTQPYPPPPQQRPPHPPQSKKKPVKPSSPKWTSIDRKWLKTFIFSILLGCFGADRFCMRQFKWGTWKLLTLGGFGWWWFADIIYLATHRRSFFVANQNEISWRRYSKGIAISSSILPIFLFCLFQVSVGSFKVYGASMLPGIENGDYILVSKATYFFNDPQRGDIIVFHSPNDPNIDCICRIIALPGDSVEIKDNTVFVNGTHLVEPYTLEPPHYLMPHEEIPSGHYFVLGDNRNNSLDSHRGWTLPRENIIGKIWIKYWHQK
jgi:signal peptidase I